MSERLALPVVPMSVCLVCGEPAGREHDDCIAEEPTPAGAAHPYVLPAHDPDGCLLCMAQREERSDRRCGKSCLGLIFEAPVRERGSPMTNSGEILLDQADWFLKGSGSACVFLEVDGDGQTRCGIYETRPVMCRKYRCENSGRSSTKLEVVAPLRNASSLPG